ncbi:uncharacterized protein LOC110431142 [Sorghum bicolor]|uniref:uncharacterized protein LOC110431142 n=1 Tax=Sorghum bicolor TaxID=4558 RepID=UPI000B423B39|nr:uncharacterized protein LOC110431142 [Sorghum bicolor]|eukprot:XP_021305526.1 uncharacterized protein LOC110431142 [Sorghum bicolor]
MQNRTGEGTVDLEQGRGAGEEEGSGAGERSWEGSGQRGRGEEQGRTLRLRTSSFQAGGEELAQRGGGRPAAAGRRTSGNGGEEGVRRGGGRPAGRSSTCKGQMAATRESSALFTPCGRLGAQSRGKARALDRSRQNFRGPRASAYAPPSALQRRLDAA